MFRLSKQITLIISSPCVKLTSIVPVKINLRSDWWLQPVASEASVALASSLSQSPQPVTAFSAQTILATVPHTVYSLKSLKNETKNFALFSTINYAPMRLPYLSSTNAANSSADSTSTPGWSLAVRHSAALEW